MSLLVEGDVVKYIGMNGVYMGGVELTYGDTGVVIEISKPSHHKDRTVHVRLFKSADEVISLPRGFWCHV